MSVYYVTAVRTVKQQVMVVVNADSAEDAEECVLKQYAPAQWPDGEYIGASGRAKPDIVYVRKAGENTR